MKKTNITLGLLLFSSVLFAQAGQTEKAKKTALIKANPTIYQSNGGVLYDDVLPDTPKNEAFTDASNSFIIHNASRVTLDEPIRSESWLVALNRNLKQDAEAYRITKDKLIRDNQAAHDLLIPNKSDEPRLSVEERTAKYASK